MTIEPVIGIQGKNGIVSENDFSAFSVFSTAQMLREYFTQYGYQVVGFYDDNKELVIVKDNNLDLALITGDYNSFRVLNYRTGEIEISRLDITEAASHFFSSDVTKVYSFTHHIDQVDTEMRLIHKATSTTVLEAEFITFLSTDLLLVNSYGLQSIFCISENQSYPIIKREKNIYMGPSPDEFVDMRFGMYLTFQNNIQPLLANSINLLEIVKEYPYGEKRGNRFKLLRLAIKHGIFYKNADTSKTKWYESKEKRDQVLSELGVLVEDTLSGRYVKVMKD